MFNIRSLPRTFGPDGVAILLLVLLLRIPFFLVSSSHPIERQYTEDSRGYLDLAQNLNQGLGFGRYFQTNSALPPVWIPELCRTPGYPWIIAKLDREPDQSARATILLQQFIEIALCLTVFAICYLSFGRVPGIVAGALMAVDVQGITLANMLLSEMTFTACFIGAALAATRLLKKNGLIWAVVTGLLIGVSVLIRPTTLYLGAFAGLFLIGIGIWRRQWVHLATAVVLVAATYVPVGAWMARNKAQCGSLSITTMQQCGALGQAAAALARDKGVSLKVGLDEICGKAGVDFWRMRFVAISAEEKRRVAEVTTPILRAHPKALLREYVVRTADVVIGPEKYTLQVLGLPSISFGLMDSSANKAGSNGLGWTLLGVQVIFTLLIYAGVLRTLWQALGGRVFPAWVWASFWFSMYTVGISAAACIGDPRYRWPTIPLLIIVAVASFTGSRVRPALEVQSNEEKTSAMAAR